MNQILVTEKLYVTPDLKRKRKLYKVVFFISVLLVCLLSSYYIYAEYDRGKSEEVSQVLLSEVKSDDDTTKKSTKDDAIIIVLNEEDSNEQESVANEVVSSTIGDITYTTEAIITIPKIGITYPVLSETSDELLEISVNRYWPEQDKMKPNDIGNYCIVGHNYRNGKMFGRLSELENGDIVELEDMSGRTIEYEVYNKYVVEPTDTSCTSQMANGKPLTFRELTLITCTNYGTQRLVVKCREVK